MIPNSSTPLPSFGNDSSKEKDMKKIISALLALLMLIPMLTFTASAEEPFADVKESHWYYRAVEYCYEKGLMSGMTPTTFKATGKVTREQFVQTLANMEGIDKNEYNNPDTPFKDVKANAWYAPAVEWARQTGIVAGLSEDTFGVGKSITREQIARLLRGYAEYKGKDVSASADLSAFTDDDRISPWALDGFKYAVAGGIFKGNAKNELNPRGSATRAELATILKAVRSYDNNKLVAWGDSLTQGIIEGFHDIAEYPYPARVAQSLNVPYDNFGIGGETAEAIAIRQGGIAIYVNDITIPAEVTTIPLPIVAEEGYSTKTLAEAGEKGLNPVTIDGIEGRITWNKDYERHEFTRTTAGEEKVITTETRVITAGMSYDYTNSILVICSGANNTKDRVWHDEPEKHMEYLCKIQKKMVDYAGTDNFVIIGLPKVRFMELIPNYNYILEEYWGEHYVDLNEYMMTEQALIDNGITSRGFDRKDIAEGFIPRSLLDEEQQLHPNQIGYDIISGLVVDKIYELDCLN